MTSECKYLSRIEMTPAGRKTLVVCYDNTKRDWDDAIEWAIKHHNLPETVQAIALPESLFVAWAPMSLQWHTTAIKQAKQGAHR